MSSLNATATPGYGFSTSNGVVKSVGNIAPNAFLYPHHDPQVARELIAVANSLVRPRGRGIYATDETPEGIEARLEAAFGTEGQSEPKKWTEDEKRERRKRWRECLYQSLPTGQSYPTSDHPTLKNLLSSEYISGVILHSETLIDFKLAPILADRGIIPGVRADTDSHPLPISSIEPATQGLDDLLPRLQEAKSHGARFTKVGT